MCEAISELIEKEVETGIPLQRIVVGGFSMGGALSLYMAYRQKKSLAGCFVMSSFLNNNSVVYEVRNFYKLNKFIQSECNGGIFQ